MADNVTVKGLERTATGDDECEETVLASPRVQATVDGATWAGTPEVLLERGRCPAIAIECLFDQGIEAALAATAVRQPER